MLGSLRSKGLLNLARAVANVFPEGPAATNGICAVQKSHKGSFSQGGEAQGPQAPAAWQPRIPREDGSVEPLDPAPAIFIVYQFLKQRGYHRCAGILAMDAKEDLEKMRHLEGNEVDLVELLDEYWFLTTCEERRDQLASRNPFVEDLCRMLDAHLGVNPWQPALPGPQSYMRSAEEVEPVSERHPQNVDAGMPADPADMLSQNRPQHDMDPSTKHKAPNASAFPFSSLAQQGAKNLKGFTDTWVEQPPKASSSDRSGASSAVPRAGDHRKSKK